MAQLAIPSLQRSIAVVDDDSELRGEVARYFQRSGFEVLEAEDGTSLDRLLLTSNVDLIILDVMMPNEDGLSICRRLTANGGPLLLIMSAMGETLDKVVGLEVGADDYVSKPVDPRELLARVRAMFRRRGNAERRVETSRGYRFAGFQLDLSKRKLLSPSGVSVVLTAGEFTLLCAFLAHPNEVLSREFLLESVRGEDADVVERAVDVQISRLRRKLETDETPEIIKTHRGAGYILDVTVEPF